ncbi:hypothetical protein [Actinoplanes sp. NPDC051494]|uniref:hypothetical protein n=1 Tax=Actinoplanes sp. NPDC051494 TaxID=3363907 RepID=UPI0037AEB6CD
MPQGPRETPPWFTPDGLPPTPPRRRPSLSDRAFPRERRRRPHRLPLRVQLPDRPQQHRVSAWAAARCDEIAGDVARGGLWRFTEVVADVLYPGLGVAVAAAQRATKWGPQLVGLTDERGSDVKIGLVGSDHLGLWTVFRTRLDQSDPGPRPAWCTDVPAGPLGAEGVRREATVISGIEDVKPADVAALLLIPPPPGADTRILTRIDVPTRSGVLAVDAGDGTWQRRLFFTVVHPPTRGDGHHDRYRVVCPTCTGRRLAQFRGFDVCSDCGRLDL